jgi:N-acetyl-gamma-glutamyl-phosphate reductase
MQILIARFLCEFKMERKLKSIKKIRAAVIGGSGYTGLEILKILSNHRYVDIVFTTSNTYRGMVVGEAFPSFNEIYIKKPLEKSIRKSVKFDKGVKRENQSELVYTLIDEVSENTVKNLDVIFLCLLPLESMEFVNRYLGGFNGVIIDIGSDFRLKNPQSFRNWYGKEHILKELLEDFVYGLPEIYAEKIKVSRLIANPGCYPTSIILALAPILKDREIKINDINIDSKSGVSGAGRKLKDDYLFCNVNENFFAYSALMHRHIGEIEQEIENISGEKINVCFTPHILPVNRGIFTSIYCRLDISPNNSGLGAETENIDKATKIKEKVFNDFNSFYGDSCFVKFIGEKIPQLKDVIATNMCFIGFVFDERTSVLKLFSVIDNLLKGAAGQAVQNMNLIFNFDETEGLDSYGLFS